MRTLRPAPTPLEASLPAVSYDCPQLDDAHSPKSRHHRFTLVKQLFVMRARSAAMSRRGTTILHYRF